MYIVHMDKNELDKLYTFVQNNENQLSFYNRKANFVDNVIKHIHDSLQQAVWAGRRTSVSLKSQLKGPEQHAVFNCYR